MITRVKIWILAIGLFTCLNSNGEEYPIKFTRPYKSGEKYTKKASTETKMAFSLWDEKNSKTKSQAQSFSLDYNGIETISKTSKNGERLAIDSKISQFDLTAQGAKHSIIPKGKVLQAVTEENKTVYKVDGKVIPPGIRQYFGEIISTDKPGEISADKTLGTEEKKKVGDKWKIDSKLMEKEIDSGIFDVSNVVGSVEFKKIATIDNIKCMLLITEVKANISHYKTTNTKVKNGNFKWTISSYYPLDVKKHMLKETQTLSTTLECPTPNKSGWTTKIDITQKSEKKYEYNLTKPTSKKQGGVDFGDVFGSSRK